MIIREAKTGNTNLIVFGSYNKTEHNIQIEQKTRTLFDLENFEM